MYTRSLFHKSTFIFAIALFTGTNANAQDQLDDVTVIGITPTHGVGLPEEQIPFNVQSANSEDIERTQSFDLTDFINRNLSSVTLNDAQNNPLQSDVQYRGFTLSPLLGLPQGLSVFQNGVRINEPFGDSMNWDLLPESAIGSVNLVGGANPLFGLNTLGGALSIQTKNGFTHPGHSIETYGGSFERFVTTAESGWNNGDWGYFVTANYFDEEGWRDASPSDALNFFGTFGYRGDVTTFDMSFTYANTDLIGNGAIPVELEALDREAAFTSPDQTRNDMGMLIAEATHWVNDTTQLSGNVFFRRNETNSFNGDGSEFEECDPPNAGVLCEEDDLTDPIEDQFGNDIDEDNANGSERNAINNISERDQKGFGGTLQATFLNDLFGRENQFIIGGGYQQGVIDFRSITEISTLGCEFNGADCTLPGADRGTIASGLFVPDEGTKIKSHNRTWSLYVTDTIAVTDRFNLTLSGRYNNSSIMLGDRSGTDDLVEADDPAALNGEHDYDRFNPAVGVTYDLTSQSNVFASYSESSRAPTPIELLCADPNAPCSLPNAFLADPPLEEVVTKSFEGGVRGSVRKVNYSVAAFHSTNNDDIIFTSTGGVGSNEGFFRNVGDTERVGVELGLSGELERMAWYLNYSFVEATFETGFQAASANHPLADANDEITVSSGDRIPGIPQHSLKLGGIYSITPKLDVGASLVYNSDQYSRGDEANLLDPIDDYVVVNINGQYKFNDMFTVFARVNNLFDTDYETFGLLGEADEIFDGSGATPAFSNAQFVGVGAPINGFVGVRVNF